VIFGLGALLATLPVVAAMPDYLREALNQFSPEVPAGWAYTLTTVRNDDARSTARFDPSRPPAEQWTLLELNGRPPTPKEAGQFARARASGGNIATPQGNFQKGDIDPGSIELLTEDAVRAEFRCTFRAEAAGADKMLGHLRLRLFVDKKLSHVEKFVLELPESYSPVLGVKMRELDVQVSFTAPSAGQPGLPATGRSRFLGRIFFIGMEENIDLTYSDFVRVP
jgi:hypothetical protein